MVLICEWLRGARRGGYGILCVYKTLMRAFMYLSTIRSLLRPSMTLALFMQRERGRRCFSGSSPSPPRLDGSGPSGASLRAGCAYSRRCVAHADEFSSRHGAMSISVVFCQIACEVAGFLEQFPGAVDIVFVKSELWTEYHKAIMEALTEGVRMFLRQRKHLSFEQLLDYFKESQPCAVSGALHVSLLYGRETALYLDDSAKLKMDIKGLVFRKP